MALINLIKIDDQSGALLADEEFWRRGSRRTHSLDNLQPILPESFCEATGMEAVIGIVGDPSITFEAILRVKKRLKHVTGDPEKNGRKETVHTLKEVVDLAVEEIDQLIRKRIDDQLRFAYGFTMDDLNRGYFEADGNRIDIAQESIRSDVLKWLKHQSAPPRLKSLLDVNVVFAGVDEKHGFHWYEWSGVGGTTFLGTGYFETIGKGSDAASLAFIDIFRRRELQRRRKGMGRPDALFALMEAMEAALRFNHEVGGYPQIVTIDARGKTHADRYTEFSGPATKLGMEIVTAWIHGYIPRSRAMDLLVLVFEKDVDAAAVEEKMFKAARKPKALELFLRGYKSSVANPREEPES